LILESPRPIKMEHEILIIPGISTPIPTDRKYALSCRWLVFSSIARRFWKAKLFYLKGQINMIDLTRSSFVSSRSTGRNLFLLVCHQKTLGRILSGRVL
jgi:hypothetical protein